MLGNTPDYRVVILGAGPGVRGGIPAALVPVGNEGRLLDWLLESFAGLAGVEINFVSGFMAQEVMRQYKDIQFHHNPDWECTGSAKSLAVAPLSSRIATFICYSDVVFRESTVQRLNKQSGDLVVAVDRQWKVRYDGRSDSELADAEKVTIEEGALGRIGQDVSTSEADAEFIGLIKLSGHTAKRVSNVLTSSTFSAGDGLPEVLSLLLAHGVVGKPVDVKGDWAELNAPQDLARFVLGTKAESLERLMPLVKSGHIMGLIRFNLEEWSENQDQVLASIHERYPDTPLIVRSSSLSEDSWTESAAGAFESVPNVPSADLVALKQAVATVFASYPDARPANQILVQEMLNDVRLSGVVMTRTHSQGAPYFVINYDDTTSRTDTVTSGEGRELKTLFLHRNSQPSSSVSPDILKVLAAIRELEQLVGHDSLDIEFAVTRDGLVHVLQVRPIAVTHDNRTINDEAVRDGIKTARESFLEYQTPSPFILGRFTSFSVMSDWNPAEIIGTKPSQLSFSLYRYIITDETWARQRAEYGYRDVRPANLLVDVLGHPYVNVRTTFNSFLPAALPDDLAQRLVEHHLEHLRHNPELHDKVEFDILFTCWAFDHTEQTRRLRDTPGLTEKEAHLFGDALLEITRAGIRRCEADYSALERSQERFEAIRDAQIEPLERAYLHLENAREYGALHFSHLARAAFVAVSLLRSMVNTGIISQLEQDNFLASLSTVSTLIQQDAGRVANGEMAWDEFVATYGHLRPGTYDINSPRYANAPEEFLRPIVEQASSNSASHENPWPEATILRVSEALKTHDLGVDYDGFVKFLRLAIEGREWGKFIFTRDLSGALEAFSTFGAEHFIPREQLSHVPVHELLALRATRFENVANRLLKVSKDGKARSAVRQAFCLPDQIFAPDDLSCFEFRKVMPNFVTQGKVRAPVVVLDQTSSPSTDLTGKIVVIPNADPGFDWIFARGLLGLITMYGGANSHMAIRMAEFELPGVTGVGESLFASLSSSKVVDLDCAARQIRIVH